MNRRISKKMAEEASDIMKNKAYGRKIENAKAEINVLAEKLVRKYIPSPVIACVNEYSEYINYTTGVRFTTTYEKNGWTTSASPIVGVLSFLIPYSGNYIKVDGKEFEALQKLNTKYLQLKKERDDFGDQVYDALIALRTEKAIEKELPEAMKYLKFPEVKAVPMPLFRGLRDIIGKIEEG